MMGTHTKHAKIHFSCANFLTSYVHCLKKKERQYPAVKESVVFVSYLQPGTKKKFRGPTINQATDLLDSASECCTLLRIGRSLSLYVILNRHTAGMSNVEIPAQLNRKRKLRNFKLVTEIKKDPRSSFVIQFKYLSLFHLCILYFLQVRNKLDNCLYAVKRIPLNPKSTQLNKRIMREVQLISRLNHENVVR